MRACPSCGKGNPDTMTRCLHCGAYLGYPAPAPPTGGAPLASSSAPTALPPPPGVWLPPPPSWPGSPSPLPPPYQPTAPYDFEAMRARGRTRTGLLLLAVGVGMSWIPFVGSIGGLLALIGVILLFLGRWGFGEVHHRRVLVGGGLLLVALIGAVVVALSIESAIFSAVIGPSVTPQAALAAAESAIRNALLATLVLGLLGAIGQVLMVVTLADTTSRWLLVGGLVASLLLGLLLYSVEVPLLNSALQAATSGPTVQLAPLNQFENQIEIYGLLQIIPAALTAAAYYRTYRRLDERAGYSPIGPE